jgi:hypothetical protein
VLSNYNYKGPKRTIELATDSDDNDLVKPNSNKIGIGSPPTLPVSQIPNSENHLDLKGSNGIASSPPTLPVSQILNIENHLDLKGSHGIATNEKTFSEAR